jgi:heme-binding NEAT domain protein
MTMFKRASRKNAESAEPDAKPEKPAKPAKQPKPAKPAKAAKPAKPAEPQVYRKPRADIYTVMLSIALIVAALAATALWMTMSDYHYEIKGGPNPVWNLPAAPAAFDPPRAVV